MMSNLTHTATLMHLLLPCWHMNYLNLSGAMSHDSSYHVTSRRSQIPKVKTHQKISGYQIDILLSLTGEETHVNTLKGNSGVCQPGCHSRISVRCDQRDNILLATFCCRDLRHAVRQEKSSQTPKVNTESSPWEILVAVVANSIA